MVYLPIYFSYGSLALSQSCSGQKQQMIMVFKSFSDWVEFSCHAHISLPVDTQLVCAHGRWMSSWISAGFKWWCITSWKYYLSYPLWTSWWNNHVSINQCELLMMGSKWQALDIKYIPWNIHTILLWCISLYPMLSADSRFWLANNLEI